MKTSKENLRGFLQSALGQEIGALTLLNFCLNGYDLEKSICDITKRINYWIDDTKETDTMSAKKQCSCSSS